MCLLLLGILAAGGGALAETRWISDDLRVPLRSGPSGEHTILHRGLPAGTELEVLERDETAGFVRIRTVNGSDGWVPAQYLVDKPIARDRLPVLEKQIDTLQATVTTLRAELAASSTSTTETNADNDELQRQVDSLQAELSELQRISQSAVEQHATVQRLEVLNERLRRELDDLGAANAALQDNLQQRWLLIGSGILLAGLLLGVLIKARPRRSAWS